jgi:hypothetical protein
MSPYAVSLHPHTFNNTCYSFFVENNKQENNMSPVHYPVFALFEGDTPENIENRIGLLIRLYVCQPEQEIAMAVVKHINAILAHPKYITNTMARCQLRKLSEHWRYMIWNNSLKQEVK